MLSIDGGANTVNVDTRQLHCFAAACLLLLLELPAHAEVARSNRETDTIQTSAGALKIMPVYHGSVMLEFGGKVIYIDPWSQGDYSGLPQADMLIFTHTHADHLDRAMIDKLKKPGTIL